MQEKNESKWFTPERIISYVMTLLMIAVSYQNFKNDTANAVRDNAKANEVNAIRLSKIEGALHKRTTYMYDSSNIANYLCGKDTGCERRFPVLKVPN